MLSRPILRVFYDLPATGKSSLATQTANLIFSPLLSSDQIRKVYLSTSHPQVSTFGKGIYRKDLRQRVYSLLMARLKKDGKKAVRSF